MWTDPIVEELHARRREHAQAVGFDLHQLFLELRELDETASATRSEVVLLPAKRLTALKEAA